MQAVSAIIAFGPGRFPGYAIGMADAVDHDVMLAQFQQVFENWVPHNKELGLEMTGYESKAAIIRLPYDDKLVGDPATGILHGGAITTLMDATCGACVFVARKKPGRIATLDLRIDYLRPATPKEDVICRAECYRITRSVAFVRGMAHHGDAERPIAHAAGSFMLFDQHFGPEKTGSAKSDERAQGKES